MAIKGIGNGLGAYEQLRIKQQKELEKTEGHSGASRADSTSKSDNINVSEDAKLLSTALDTAKNAPETRAEKVARLKGMVADGTYDVDGRTVAEKMVQEEIDLRE